MLLSWFLMGKEPKNEFCYISVNNILKMTSQYNTPRGSFTELLFKFRHCPCCNIAPTPFALQSAPNSDRYQVNSTSTCSNVMSSGFISNSSFTNCTFQFSSKWCESFPVVDCKMVSVIRQRNCSGRPLPRATCYTLLRGKVPMIFFFSL